jgi:serine/threonine protein kinase
LHGLRGGVFRAIDLGAEPARLCLLKKAWHDVSLDPLGRDARHWLANEERILTRFDRDPFVQRFYDRFDLDDDRFVAIEYIEGTTLDRALSDKHSMTDGIPTSDIAAIGLATAEALAHLHEIGLSSVISNPRT